MNELVEQALAKRQTEALEAIAKELLELRKLLSNIIHGDQTVGVNVV